MAEKITLGKVDFQIDFLNSLIFYLQLVATVARRPILKLQD
jgi:hypothetical protein